MSGLVIPSHLSNLELVKLNSSLGLSMRMLVARKMMVRPVGVNPELILATSSVAPGIWVRAN